MNAIIQRLLATSAVTDLVGQAIFPVDAPQETGGKYIVVDVFDDDPSDTKDGPSTLDTEYTRIFAYADNYPDSEAIASAVRTAVDRWSGTAGGQTVQSVRFDTKSTFTEDYSNNKKYVTEHIYKVRIKR